MVRARPSLRLFAALLAAALPPLIALALIVAAQPAWLGGMGGGVVIAIAGGILWCGLVAVLAARPFAGEARSMVTLAERGLAPDRALDGQAAADGLSGA